MSLLRCLVSTYDQIPDVIFYIISVECGRRSYFNCVTSRSGNEWRERSVLTGWVIEQLRCPFVLFAFVSYECSHGLILPLEGGENPGPPDRTDSPGVEFSP